MFGLKNKEKKLESMERWVFDVSEFVSHVAWSHDGLFVAVSLVSGPIEIFNREDGSQKTLEGHEFGTMEISWSPDNSKLVSVGQDGKLKIWDVNTQKILKTLEGGASWVEHVSWSSDSDSIASTAGKILRVWNSEGNLIQEYKDHKSTITAIQWNSSGTEIATASYGKITIYVIGKNEPQTVLPYPSSLVSLTWHPSGKWIVAGTQEGHMCAWRLPNEKGSHITVRGFEYKLTNLSWSKDGKNLGTVGSSWIAIWDFTGKGPEKKKEPIMIEDDGQARITQMLYQNNGDLLVSGTKDGSIFFWLPSMPKKPQLSLEVGSAINQLEWSKDGQFLIVCSEDGIVRIWKSPEVKSKK